MTSQSQVENLYSRSGTDATVARPALWPALVRLVSYAVSRGWRTVRPRLACLATGHERWTSRSGDWVCMRCGKLEISELPQFPARPDAARKIELPRFD